MAPGAALPAAWARRAVPGGRPDGRRRGRARAAGTAAAGRGGQGRAGHRPTRGSRDRKAGEGAREDHAPLTGIGEHRRALVSPCVRGHYGIVPF